MFQRAALAVIALASATQAQVAAAFDLTPGNLYSAPGLTWVNSLAITEYDSAGNPLGAINVPAALGYQVQGLTFGADKLLYAVVVESDRNHFRIVQIDGSGTARGVFRAPCNGLTNAAGGQIVSQPNGDLYVAYNEKLLAFNIYSGNSYTVTTSGQTAVDIDAVAPLPSGNLLIASWDRIKEITPAGVVVRTINPGYFFEDIRGLAYDADSNRIFVGELGIQNYQLLALDGTSGAVLKNALLYYPAQMLVTSGKSLLVGTTANYDVARLFDEDLNQWGTLRNTVTQPFVTEMPLEEEVGIDVCDPDPNIECANPPPPVWQPPPR